MEKRWFVALIFIVPVSFVSATYADEPATADVVDPYISNLKRELETEDVADEKGPPKGQYIQSIRDGLGEVEEGPPPGGYIESVRNSEEFIERGKKKKPKPESSFLEDRQGAIHLEEEKRAKDEADDPYRPEKDSAIEAVKKGQSELQLKRPGKIRHALGFRLGASLTRNIHVQGGSGSSSFKSFYGDRWNPDVALTYEIKPFYSEWFGSLGFTLSPGLWYFGGKGRYRFNLTNEKTGQSFGDVSGTELFLNVVTVSTGAIYRFNLPYVIRPLASVAHTWFLYYEGRNDGGEGRRGYSTGMQTSVGAALLLDWLSRESAWNYYQDFNVKHYYFQVEYQKIFPLVGDVRFDVWGIYAGATFEI